MVTVTGFFIRDSARVLPWQPEWAVIVAANPAPPRQAPRDRRARVGAVRSGGSTQDRPPARLDRCLHTADVAPDQRFGIVPDQVRGRRILDLGCNNGAMLFQLSNYGPARSLGIEYDREKVELAQRIAEFAAIDQLEFRVGDLDQMQATDMGGSFDIVLCLAIEAHVKNPAHLYELLAGVTRGRLYFEANSSTPPGDVRAKLQQAGFSQIEHLGVCDDDIVPRNNRRPLFSAVMS
jgi:SAM-dependent methyltransferase